MKLILILIGVFFSFLIFVITKINSTYNKFQPKAFKKDGYSGMFRKFYNSERLD